MYHLIQFSTNCEEHLSMVYSTTGPTPPYYPTPNQQPRVHPVRCLELCEFAGAQASGNL